MQYKKICNLEYNYFCFVFNTCLYKIDVQHSETNNIINNNINTVYLNLK